MDTNARILSEENRILETAAKREEAFEKFFLKGDYTDCFVNEKYVAFWGRQNSDSPIVSPRFVYFGSQGAVGFYLDDLTPDFGDNKAYQDDVKNKFTSWNSIKNRIEAIHITDSFIQVTGRSRNFQIVTYKFKIGNINSKARVDPEKVILIPNTVNRRISFLTTGTQVSTGRILQEVSRGVLELKWEKKVNVLGWVVWGTGGVFFISFLILVIISLFKTSGKKRAVNLFSYFSKIYLFRNT